MLIFFSDESRLESGSFRIITFLFYINPLTSEPSFVGYYYVETF